MRSFGKLLGRVLLILIALVGTMWFWPPATGVTPPRFDAGTLPEDLDGWLDARESVFTDLVPGTAKRIHWAAERGEKTPFALVYVHGFSASSEEVRPTPELIAADLGANIFYTRLAGHARGFAPMGEANPDDWLTDLAEALAIGARIGDRVIVMATSTGGTIAVAGLGTPAVRAAMPDADKVAGLALISPNIQIANRVNGRLLDLPLAEYWIPPLRGHEYSFTPANEGHATYWTTRYPMQAVFSMAHIMRVARAVDVSQMTLPVLLLTSPDDGVVDPKAGLEFFSGWEGPVTVSQKPMREGMDPDAHVIAGNIRSPGLTREVAREISDWAGGL
jgi:alpha-beta hydrolase superfamily lysophospholipase